MIDDDQWFAGLVRAHRTDLRAYAARRVAPADVDDVVSEVFATAWRCREQLPAGAERMWLYRTAWHTVLHQFRDARRRERLSSRIAREPLDVDGGSTGDDGAAVRAALARLRPSDQELLRLTYWERLSAEEVAKVVGGTPGAVRVRLHRARRRLAAVLGHGAGSREGPSAVASRLEPTPGASS